jgi:hypothetical protein
VPEIPKDHPLNQPDTPEQKPAENNGPQHAAAAS